MKSRIARLGVLLVSVMALVAGFAPSAEANQVGVLVIQGRANVGTGISYPCVDNSLPSVPKCPPPLGTANLNQASVSFTGSGAGVVAKVAKPKCGTACVEVGTVNITANGTVNGSCGLSSGDLSGSVTADVSLGTKINNRNFRVLFTGVGGLLILDGSVTSSQGERILGATVAIPDATVGSTCANKSAKIFIVAGVVVVARV